MNEKKCMPKYQRSLLLGDTNNSEKVTAWEIVDCYTYYIRCLFLVRLLLTEFKWHDVGKHDFMNEVLEIRHMYIDYIFTCWRVQKSISIVPDELEYFRFLPLSLFHDFLHCRDDTICLVLCAVFATLLSRSC